MRRVLYMILSVVYVILFSILLTVFLLCIITIALFYLPYNYATCEDIDDPFSKESKTKNENKET